MSTQLFEELDTYPTRGPSDNRRPHGQIALVDLLDRLLGTGVVLAGDLVISMAGVDLVQVRLNALIATVRADMLEPADASGTADRAVAGAVEQ